LSSPNWAQPLLRPVTSFRRPGRPTTSSAPASSASGYRPRCGLSPDQCYSATSRYSHASRARRKSRQAARRTGKNPAAPAVKREAEEDWGTKRWARGRKQPIVRLRISNNPAMGEAKEKRRAHAVILTAHPWCIYCGMKANTIEHMPPRAMFDKRPKAEGIRISHMPGL
jgi:hypothetical protein